MRKYLIISVSLLAFLLFSSKKCDPPENEDAAREEIAFKATLDSINEVFEADHLSEQTLQAFEMKAKQKLVDFADYLQIFSDKSLYESFKDHARQMIHDLFVSDSVLINLKVSDELKEKDLTINEFLKVISASGSITTVVIIDSIEISERLQKVNDNRYAGSLQFSYQHEISSDPNFALTGSVCKRVDIIVTKIRKQFGSNTLQIWQVCLGNIR
jgi:hypothetical protein